MASLSLQCQRCSKGLQLDSAGDLSDSVREFKDSFGRELDEEFIVLEAVEKKEENASTFAELEWAMTRLYEIAADESYSDFPMCSVCAEKVEDIQKRKMKEMERERDLY